MDLRGRACGHSQKYQNLKIPEEGLEATRSKWFAVPELFIIFTTAILDTTTPNNYFMFFSDHLLKVFSVNEL